MEWKKPTLKLCPNISDYNNIYCKYTYGRYPCVYCGGIYKKNMRTVNTNNKKYICCDICYSVTHINAISDKYIVLCHSKKSQLDIVRDTVNYISENNVIPFFNEIDKNAKLIPISLIEYSNVLASNINLPSFTNNYKIFITQDYDTTFIDTYGLLLNDDYEPPTSSKYSIHKLSNNEILFFNNFFS